MSRANIFSRGCLQAGGASKAAVLPEDRFSKQCGPIGVTRTTHFPASLDYGLPETQIPGTFKYGARADGAKKHLIVSKKRSGNGLETSPYHGNGGEGCSR